MQCFSVTGLGRCKGEENVCKDDPGKTISGDGGKVLSKNYMARETIVDGDNPFSSDDESYLRPPPFVPGKMR